MPHSSPCRHSCLNTPSVLSPIPMLYAQSVPTNSVHLIVQPSAWVPHARVHLVVSLTIPSGVTILVNFSCVLTQTKERHTNPSAACNQPHVSVKTVQVRAPPMRFHEATYLDAIYYPVAIAPATEASSHVCKRNTCSCRSGKFNTSLSIVSLLVVSPGFSAHTDLSLGTCVWVQTVGLFLFFVSSTASWSSRYQLAPTSAPQQVHQISQPL